MAEQAKQATKQPTPLELAHAARKVTSAARANETPDQKLKRLAGSRVPAVIKKLRAIGNLAAYGITAAQAEKVYGVLESEMESIKVKFKQAVEGKSASKVEDSFAL